MTELKGIEIRALALHIPPPRTSNFHTYIEEIVRYADTFLDDVNKLIDKLRIKIRTKRIILPFYETFLRSFSYKVEKIIELFYEILVNDKGFDYIALPFRKINEEVKKALPELLQIYPKLFSSTQYDSGSEELLRILYEIPERGWINAAKFAISFGEQLETPYFPATVSKNKGVSASLLYPDFLLKQNSLKEMEIEAKKALSKIYSALSNMKNTFLGIDFSLSPWMESSVARVIEKVSGTVFSSPGTIKAIIEINNLINVLVSNLRSLGYNELMLPLGEDNRLKELALVGQLRLSNLVSYTTYCVAGLDMVPLPDTIQPNILKNLLEDLNAIHNLKKKTIGARIILVGAEPGSEIELGFFGKVPVLDPFL